MAMSYNCKFCGHQNWTEESRAGTERACGSCGKISTVPGGAPKDNVGSPLFYSPSPDYSARPKPALKTCPYCAEKDLQPDAKFCKHCRKKLDGSGLGWLGSLAIILMVLGILVFPFCIIPGVILIIIWAVLRSI